MKTCKDCIYQKRCVPTDTTLDSCYEVENYCKDFSDRSEWVHKPCNIGDTVYSIINSARKVQIVQGNVANIVFDNKGSLVISVHFSDSRVAYFADCDFGKIVFLNRSTAERLKRKVEELRRKEVSKYVY